MDENSEELLKQIHSMLLITESKFSVRSDDFELSLGTLSHDIHSWRSQLESHVDKLQWVVTALQQKAVPPMSVVDPPATTMEDPTANHIAS
jgi:hypothetical protein